VALLSELNRPPRRTVGVEEELLLFTAHGSRLSLSGQELSDPEDAGSDGGRDDPGPSVEHEFKRQQVETISSPLADLADLAEELLRSRRDVADRGVAHGAVPAALATDPAPAEPVTTDHPRYQRMVQEFGAIARRQLTCGMHVHVAVHDRDEGVAVLDRIRAWLPVLLALSANSPFHQGHDTGYASYRTVRQQMWPTAGPTDLFGSLPAYDAEVAELVASGAALDEGMIYFDARLSASYPTVEIRVMDVTPTSATAVALAGLCRAMVDTAVAEWQAGIAPLDVRRAAVRAATWRAARWGLAEQLVRPGPVELAPAGEVVAQLLDWVRPALRANGDVELVEDAVGSLLGAGPDPGNGADRQRRAFQRRGRIDDVVADGVAWTLSDG
jgi:carboxylate-amine ligase